MSNIAFATLPVSHRGIDIVTGAVEIGYGDTKSAYRNAMCTVIHNAFESLSPIYTKPIIAPAIGPRGARNTFVVKVRDKLYEVGPDVQDAVGGSINLGRNLGDSFPETDQYEALLLGAISNMNAASIHHLVLGLPVHNMPKYADYLKEKFTTTLSLSDRTVRIGKVSVLPQPIGTLIRYAGDDGRRVVQGENLLVIDPGYFSTDWIVANGFRINEQRSSGVISGVSPIIIEASKLIAEGLNVKFDRFERLGHALRTNSSLTIWNQTLTNEELWAYVQKCDHIVDECLNKIIHSVGDMGDIKAIILTGGGSVFYKRVCERRFPQLPIEMLANGSFANVEGFLMAGENTRKHA